MDSKKKKGVIYGIFGLIAMAVQPIISNARPAVLDSVYYSWMTTVFEALFFLPLMVIETRFQYQKQRREESPEENKQTEPELTTKARIAAYLFMATIFAFSLILFYAGYELAGSITGAIVLKSSVLYSMVLGVAFLHERVTKQQVMWSLVLLFGLVFSITQGFSEFLEINLGAIMLLIVPLMWNAGHSATKIVLTRGGAPPMRVIFIRTAIGAVILGVFYVLVFPREDILKFIDTQNLVSIIMIGLAYSAGHFCWYKMLQNLDLSKSVAMVAPSPVVTALFATLLLNEPFTHYHFIGMFLVLSAIFLIMREKEKIIGEDLEKNISRRLAPP